MNQADAKSIVEQAWIKVYGSLPTAQQTAYTQAVAWFENQYGRAGQFGQLAAQGMYNWGSLHAAGAPPNCPQGSAPGTDLGKVCFRVFSTDVDAAAAFIRELTQNVRYGRKRVLDAMSSTPEAVAKAMFDSSYFQGVGATNDEKVANYAKGIRRSLDAIGAGAVVPAATAPSHTLFWLAVAGGTAYWLAYRGGWQTVTRGAKTLGHGATTLARRYA